MSNLGVAARGIRRLEALGGSVGGIAGGGAHAQFRHHRQADQHQHATNRNHAQKRVEREDEHKIERHPRQIEKGDRCLTGHERPQGLHVAHRLHDLRRRTADQLQAVDQVINRLEKIALKARADTAHHLRADDFEEPLKRKQADAQYGNGNESSHRPAGQNPVIDLEHVERAGERENIDDAGENRDAKDRRARARHKRLYPAWTLRSGSGHANLLSATDSG